MSINNLLEENKNLKLVCRRYKVKLLGNWRTVAGNKEIMIDYPPKEKIKFEAEVRKAVSNVLGIIYQDYFYYPPSSDINYIF